MSIAKITILKQTSDNMLKDRPRNKDTYEKLQNTSIKDKTRKKQSRWLRHVKRRPISVLIKKGDSMIAIRTKQRHK